MTYTHVSHFGLTQELVNDERICFSGSLADCKRMALAHGMEVETYEGFIISADCGVVTRTPASPTNFATAWFKQGGMMQKLPQNQYWLSIPREIWDAEV